nr:MerR family transcriptional regulator [Tessaracoccus sp.]
MGALERCAVTCTEGGTRRYSTRELERIGEIASLLAAGLNLAGVAQVLLLRAENLELRREIEHLRRKPPSST